jgi:hypothetical protein
VGLFDRPIGTLVFRGGIGTQGAINAPLARAIPRTTTDVGRLRADLFDGTVNLNRAFVVGGGTLIL